MSANFNFTNIVNFKKLHYPLAYNPVIDREISVGESDLRLTGFFFGFHTSKGKNGTFIGSLLSVRLSRIIISKLRGQNVNLQRKYRKISEKVKFIGIS